MIDIALLKEFSETPGVSGFEGRIRQTVTEFISPFVDEYYNDNMGNLIAIKRGKGDKKVMLAGHLDEIGFIVSHINDEGFIRFHPLGGFDPKTLTAQRVILHGKKDIIGVMGSKPVHMMTKEEMGKPLSIKDFFIDTGLPKEELDKYIEIGTAITRERELIEMGECINGKSLDNRIAVYIIAELLRELKDVELPYDLYAVFTVQEEVGVRGAMIASHAINPDFAIAIDGTVAFDLPGAQPQEQCTQLGKGTAIKIMDSMTICDPRLVKYLKDLADKNDISWQAELLPAGGTDTAAMQRYGKNGSIAGALSVPMRHLHQVIEMVHKKDVRDTIDLLKLTVQHLDNYDWSH